MLTIGFMKLNALKTGAGTGTFMSSLFKFFVPVSELGSLNVEADSLFSTLRFILETWDEET